MRDDLEDKLAKDFPFMRARNVFTGQLYYDDNGNTYGFPCECGDGWYQLIHDLCQELTNYYNTKGVSMSDIMIYQIKEKFGELRFYIGNVIDGAFDIIDKYEEKSTTICELCGKSGKIRGTTWLQTLCDECYGENESKKL